MELWTLSLERSGSRVECMGGSVPRRGVRDGLTPRVRPGAAGSSDQSLGWTDISSRVSGRVNDSCRIPVRTRLSVG